MADVDGLVAAARDLADGILRLANELLAAGGAGDHVHARYVAAASELWEEAEARAVLASAGGEDAIERLVLLVRELRLLSEELRAEVRAQADRDREG